MSGRRSHPRALDRERAFPVADEEAGRLPRMFLGTVLALVLFLTWMLIEVSVQRAGRIELARTPASVLGTWTTRDSRYAGRAIRVGSNRIVIDRGQEEQAEVGTITGEWTRREHGEQVVHIDYRTDDGDRYVELTVDEPGRMRLRHPADVIWTRQ